MSESSSRFSVALVGRRCQDNINLGLGYLAAALNEADIEVYCHVLNDWRQMEGICREVISDGSALVGLSIPDGGSAYLPLGLGELLRQMGFAGHITCGGQFATLGRGWLLRRYDWLDSVVRFAGEVPLLDLARRIRNNEGLEDLPGLTTREGDGPSHPVCDQTPMSIVPKRDFFPSILDYPMTHIAATRGCMGTCSYCGPHALLRMEREEGRRAGLDRGFLDTAGVGKVKRRSVSSICDEMAKLWHRNRVRYFYFVDEHILPHDEEEALRFISELREGLRRRKVKAFGMGTMLRADRITPKMAEAFAEAGLVRVFLGVEFADDMEARLFGRRMDPGRVHALLETFQRLGVATVSNLMLVHPYSTLESITNGVRFLQRLPAGVFQATRMMVYHGTRLQRRMEREGRLDGNPLRYNYSFQDPGVEAFEGIFQRLRAEAFHDYSIAFRSHDAALALSLLRRLQQEPTFEDLSGRLDEIVWDVNALQVDAYSEAADLARQGRGFHQCSELVEKVSFEASSIARELDDLLRTVCRRADRPTGLFAPMRAAAGGSLSIIVLGTALGTGLAGLWGCVEPKTQAGPVCQMPTDDQSIPAADEPTRTSLTSATSKKKTPSCKPKDEPREKARLLKAVKKRNMCCSGYFYYEADGTPRASVRATSVFARSRRGLSYKIRNCDRALERRIQKEREKHIIKTILGSRPRCLFRGSVSVTGHDFGQLVSLRDRLHNRCPDTWPSFEILIDAKGKVVRVGSRGTVSGKHALAVQCIRKALKGLRFPCLKDHRICAEHVIIE